MGYTRDLTLWCCWYPLERGLAFTVNFFYSMSSRSQSVRGSVPANNVGAAPARGQRQPQCRSYHHRRRPAARTAHCQRY